MNETQTMSQGACLRFPLAAGLLACLFALATPVHAELPPGFTLDGTRWTYKDDKLSLRGVFLKPEGDGPFPAILISHGLGGSAQGFGTPKAREFVKMGFVCIAPDYTHSQPKDGDRKTFGASPENIRRGTKCLEILESLPYVDRKRLALYGNSMGAFLSIGLAAEIPDRVRAVVITAGGVAPSDGFPAPSTARAGKIRTPVCILHGTKDTTVPPERSQLLKDILEKNQVPNERHLFEGVSHNLHQEKAEECYRLMKAFFQKHGVLRP